MCLLQRKPGLEECLQGRVLADVPLKQQAVHQEWLLAELDEFEELVQSKDRAEVKVLENCCGSTVALLDSDPQVAGVDIGAAKHLDLEDVVRLSGHACPHRVLQVALNSCQLLQPLLL